MHSSVFDLTEPEKNIHLCYEHCIQSVPASCDRWLVLGGSANIVSSTRRAELLLDGDSGDGNHHGSRAVLSLAKKTAILQKGLGC